MFNSLITVHNLAVCYRNFLSPIIAIQGMSQGTVFTLYIEIIRYLFQNLIGCKSKIDFQGEIGIFFPLIVLRPLDGTDLNAKTSVPRYDFCSNENSSFALDLLTT